MTPSKIKKFFDTLAARDPTPKTELNYRTNYELLVAVMLSAQATDKSVNKVTPALFAAADTPAQMVALGEEKVASLISSINYCRTKAKHLIALSALLVRDHHGEVPDTREGLEALPGVGRKTANVVLSIAFGAATIAVDTHIFRVANRTGIAPGKTPREVEDNLMKIVPKQHLADAHHWLILHGRYVCIARKPKCGECVVAKFCEYEDKAV
jgi:endonuclease-3